jgi:transposase
MMLMTDKTLKPYSMTSYHNEELKSLTRYRFEKVRERAKLKSSLSRLVNILFPELEKLFPTLHQKSVYAVLEECPGASYISGCHLTHLKSILTTSSKGHYGSEKARDLKWEAIHSIGTPMPAKSMELRHTIRMINILTEEIDEIESSIKKIMDESQSPIMTIPGINYRMGAMILAEIGDFSRFDNADKILAYAGLSPSTYQSGQMTSSHSHMEKRGSRYLRYALFNATKFVCNWDESFGLYLARKISEGKHYNIAISHAAKKLIRTIYRMELTGESYSPR